jgi:hypothetical protein
MADPAALPLQPPLSLGRGGLGVLAKGCPSLHAELPFAPVGTDEER